MHRTGSCLPNVNITCQLIVDLFVHANQVRIPNTFTTGADKDQPAGQQDLLGPGHLKDPHLGRQQHHLLLGAR